MGFAVPGADLTQVLQEAAAGSSGARNELLARAYAELHRLAAASMRRESPGHPLQPTALVNEAWIRLFGAEARWENRRHFFGAAAEAMRRVLVDEARRRRAGKRGAGAEHVSLTQAGEIAADADPDIERLEECLQELETVEPRLVRVIELRYFGGLDIPATADVLGVAPATVKRDWAYARAWLLERLQAARAPGT